MINKRFILVGFIVAIVCLLSACRKTHDDYEDTNRMSKFQNFWSMGNVLDNVVKRDSIKNLYDKELNNPSSKLSPRDKMERLATLVKISRMNLSYEDAMEYSNKGFVLAKKEGDKEMDAYFQYNIGEILFDIEEYSCGSHLANAWRMLEDSKDPLLMKECGQYALASFEFQFQIMHYDNCKVTIKKALDNFEQSYNADSKVWTPAEYDSLYGTALIDMARLQARLDQHEEAKKYYNRFLATKYSKTNDGIYHELRYLRRDKQYDKALEKYTILEQRVDTADYGYHHITAFLPRLRMEKVAILEGLQRWKECCEAYESYEDARHFWAKRSNNFKMLEGYERYGVGREQVVSDDAKRVAGIRGWIIAALVVALAVFIALCVILVRLQHIIRKKNKALSENLNKRLNNKFEKTAKDKEPEKKNDKIDTDREKAEYQSLVDMFIQELTSRNLFCDADFNRNLLMTELNLSRRTFPHQFEVCTGMSIPQYILNQRLEYAADLIRRKPEYTIDAIAQESGFSGRSTFYRHFANQFGITPTEYREQIENESV